MRSEIRRRLQPHLIVVGSDAGDNPLVSHFEQDRRIPTGRYLSRFRPHWWNHVDRLSYDAPNAVKWWEDGNHDEWVWTALEKEENYDILMAYHVDTIQADKRVFWRGTGREGLSVTIADCLIVTHGTKATVHTANAMLDEFDRQYSVMAGHSHRPDYYSRMGRYKVTATIGGCGCQLLPHYNRRSVSSHWQHAYQYAIVDTQTQSTILHIVDFYYTAKTVWAHFNGEVISLGLEK
jgi:hypothetical protein